MTTRKLLAVTFVVALVLFWIRSFGLFDLVWSFDEFCQGFIDFFEMIRRHKVSSNPPLCAASRGAGFVAAIFTLAILLMGSIFVSVFLIDLAWNPESNKPDLRTIADFDPNNHEQTK